ncbi:MAG: gamma-glutamyl-gamma-aminobutyrate hydrolase family protein [Acidimicrobiales bacterium]
MKRLDEAAKRTRPSDDAVRGDRGRSVGARATAHRDQYRDRRRDPVLGHRGPPRDRRPLRRRGAPPAALPVLLPVGDLAEAATLCQRIDGLLLTGGNDVDPACYGQAAQPVPTGGDHDPSRDRFELALARQAIESGLPTLAICRGLQVVNVACGGTLIQHLDDHPDTPSEPGGDDTVSHAITMEAGSRLAARHPSLQLVNSYHHQAVDRPGSGVQVVARAEDGVVEAIEVDGADQLVAVQWHLEVLLGLPEHLALFEWLAAMAAATAGRVRPATPGPAR